MTPAFQVGDIVVDQITGEIGLLMERYLLSKGMSSDVLKIWVWNVYWVGKDIDNESRMTVWTEFGLQNIIKTGTYILYQNI